MWKSGVKADRAVFTAEQVRKLRELYDLGLRVTQIIELMQLKVHKSTVLRCAMRRTYQEIE